MSLSSQAEHLAWQQRVNKEQLRSSSFYKTHGSFYPKKRSGNTPFPKVRQTDTEVNYISGNFNLAYAFGGTKHVSYVKAQNTGTEGNSPEKSGKSRRSSKAYIKVLEKQIRNERMKRVKAETKLSKY